MKLLLITFLSLSLSFLSSAQNFDESKVAPYHLPQILKTNHGKTTRSTNAWEKRRRPEILSLFEDNVYGQMPRTYDSIRYFIRKLQPNTMSGKATLRETEITVYRLGNQLVIHLVLFTPNNRNSPPAFLLINNRDRSNTDPTRQKLSEFWPAEMLIDSGFAVAAFHVSDAAPDDKSDYVKGALAFYPEQLQSSTGMKAIGCWAWAASRVMDYFQTEKPVDPKRVAVIGHSRGGKAAVWAGAEDKRFAMVISNCSGNTGAALSRRKFGETIKAINTTFPHWFTDNYKQYSDNEESLPVDQHMLLALIAKACLCYQRYRRSLGRSERFLPGVKKCRRRVPFVW